jgi:hypothetical protein
LGPTGEFKQDTQITIKIVVELIEKEMHFQQAGGRWLQGRVTL